MSETQVVNIRLDKYDWYGGRGKNGSVPQKVGEYGWGGNPYDFRIYGHEECLKLYKEYFDKRIQEDKEFKAAILALKGKRLGCFCKLPNKFKSCHLDFVKDFIDNYQECEICKGDCSDYSCEKRKEDTTRFVKLAKEIYGN